MDDTKHKDILQKTEDSNHLLTVVILSASHELQNACGLLFTNHGDAMQDIWKAAY